MLEAPSTHASPSTSTDAAVSRFDTARSAEKYARAQVNTLMHRREVRCIRRALAGLPLGARVLDLPSGTGRLFSSLLDLGFIVTGADSSSHMIDQARQRIDREKLAAHRIALKVADARATGFPDDAFDAVVCNRLFHHVTEESERRAILRELSRICSGPLVVSFFSQLSFDGCLFSLKHHYYGTKPTDRVPIWPAVFANDVASTGREIHGFMPVRRRISKQCYAVVSPRNTSRAERN